MKPTKKSLALIAMLLLAASAFALLRQRHHLGLGNQEKPNILIVSVCSLRTADLSLYGYNRATTPKLDAFARNATVFTNAFSDRSWSNLLGFLTDITTPYLTRFGYKAIGDPLSEPMQTKVIPAAPEPIAPFYLQWPSIIRSNRDENFMFEIQKLKTRLAESRGQPFLLEVHSKFVHIPYSQPFASEPVSPGGIRGSGVESMAFLTPEEKIRLNDLSEHPEHFHNRVPALLMADQSDRTVSYVKSLPPVRAALESGEFVLRGGLNSWLGWIQNPRLMAEWRAQPGFAKDLQLIRDLYDSRIQFHDWAVGQLLDLFGDEELKKNTVVIFTGDHGESFDEHGSLAHGAQVFDESLHFPLVVHFPGAPAQRITRQVYQGFLGALVKGIIEGRVTAAALPAFVEKYPANDAIVARNCNNTELALRYRNEWKLIVNRLDNSRRLFNLAKDPGELLDESAANPEVAGKLEEMLLDPVWQTRYPSRMLESCEP